MSLSGSGTGAGALSPGPCAPPPVIQNSPEFMFHLYFLSTVRLKEGFCDWGQF